MEALITIGVIVFLLLILVAKAVKIIQEYERGVFFIIPFIDRMVKVNLQTVTMNVPPQDIITRDNVTVRVDAVIYFNVVDPTKATVEIQNYLLGTSQIAQTTLRSILGKAELDELLAKREELNDLLQAAEVIARHPIAYQLRLLQTMTEVAAEKNSTLVLPIPVELFRPFMEAMRSAEAKAGGDGPPAPAERAPASES